MLRFAAGLERLRDPVVDPFGKVVDGIATDAELDEVEGHGDTVGIRAARVKSAVGLFHNCMAWAASSPHPPAKASTTIPPAKTMIAASES